MKKYLVGDLAKVIEKLDKSKEFKIVPNYSDTSEIEVEWVKEIKEEGAEYYRIHI